MSLELGHEDITQIRSELCRVLKEAFGNVSESEPQLVANLVWKIPEAVNGNIAPILQKHGVSIECGSVFVHQQPQIKSSELPKSANSTEIGDLLLLFRRNQNNHPVVRNALLLQAKKVKEKRTYTYDDNQHHLYAKWPSFSYIRSTPKLNGRKRRVSGGHLYNGAKYLLIGNEPILPPSILIEDWGYCKDQSCNAMRNEFEIYLESNTATAQPTLPNLSSFRPFVFDLYDFMFGNAGKSFVYCPPSNCFGWSQMITDLIDITAKRVTKYISTASSRQHNKRGNGCTCLLKGILSEEFFGNAYREAANNSSSVSREIPKVPEKSGEPDPDDFGISIIEFTVEDEYTTDK